MSVLSINKFKAMKNYWQNKRSKIITFKNKSS